MNELSKDIDKLQKRAIEHGQHRAMNFMIELVARAEDYISAAGDSAIDVDAFGYWLTQEHEEYEPDPTSPEDL